MGKRKSKKDKYKIFKFLSILLIIIFLFSTPVLIQKLIKINSIECFSQYDSCPSEIESQLKTLELKEYRLVKKEVIKILSNNYLLNDFSIQYQIPSKLIVELNLKKPKYAINDSINNIYYLIDTNGVIIGTSDESNLPSISTNINYKVGEKISLKDKFALEIVEKVAWLYSVKVGYIEKEELKITLKEGVLVRFPLEGDVDVLIGGLRIIFSRLNDESQGIRMNDVREIDLRFKNPVLR